MKRLSLLNCLKSISTTPEGTVVATMFISVLEMQKM